MTLTDPETPRHHFLTWTERFEPTSLHEIVVYVDHVRPAHTNKEAVRYELTDWMSSLAAQSSEGKTT